MVEDLLAARGIVVSHQTVRLWAERFGRNFAREIRRRTAGRHCDEWHLDAAVIPGVEHRSHKGPNNRAENSHQPTRRRERIIKGFKSARHLQRFVSIHDPVANLFHIPRHEISSDHHREMRGAAIQMWNEIARP
jgi:putative transposase